MAGVYYRDALIVIIVFDLTDQNSFESLSNWRQETSDFVSAEATVVLVGNKADLREERNIAWECAKEFADRNNMTYVETSAKTGQGVEEMLRITTEAALDKKNASEAFKEVSRESDSHTEVINND